MKYRVAEYRGSRYAAVAVVDEHLIEAAAMREKYGLANYWTVEEVMDIWENYSDSLCASWLIDDQCSVEEAFGVELEEIEE